MPQPNYLVEGAENVEEFAVLLLRMVAEWKIRFNKVIVFGHSKSAVAGAIMVDRLKRTGSNVRLIHINAGIRSDYFNIEDKNSRYIDRLSDYHICPTVREVNNLKKESIEDPYISGELILDNILDIRPDDGFYIPNKKYILLAINRDFNLNNKPFLYGLIKSLSIMPYSVVFVNYENMKSKLLDYHIELPENFVSIGRLPYNNFLSIMKNSFAVITDSMTIPLEASALGVPCLSVRTKIERPDTVIRGSNILVGKDLSLIHFYLDLLEDENFRYRLGIIPQNTEPAGKKIVDILKVLKN